MNSVDKMFYILRHYNSELESILNKTNSTCAHAYNTSVQTVLNQFHTLYLLTRVKKGIDHGDAFPLATNLTLGCDNNTCFNATMALLDSLIGASECDFAFSMFEGYQTTPFDSLIRGSRSLVSSRNAYLLSLIGTGIVVESAYRILRSSDSEQWHRVQADFGLKFQQAIQRSI